MKLFLIRHADAIEYETDTVKTDDYRFITSKGRIVTREVIKTLKGKMNGMEKIFTSPLIRAVQTAEIVADRLNFQNDIEPVNELRNEYSVASLQNLLEKNKMLKSIALVGHEPKMSLTVKSLTGKFGFKEFGKSSVCLIDFNIDNGNYDYAWYFNSKKMEYEN